MSKWINRSLGFFLGVVTSASLVSAQSYEPISTIEEFNQRLPFWGVTWSADSGSVNGYHPSFYTGFAIRSEFPNRIHVRQARGNQTRVTLILDRDTVTDYLFDLVKRYEVYKKLQESNALVPVSETKAIPQLKMFSEIVLSPNYKIKSLADAANAGTVDPRTLYSHSLNVLKTLNPGRVFDLNLNLTKEFLNWRESIKKSSSGNIDAFLSNAQNEVIAIETLLWGRINLNSAPSAEQKEKLKTAATLAVNGSDEAFLSAAKELFLALTQNKYDFEVIKKGNWAKALDCEKVTACFLTYTEFTTIYPTGSAKMSTSDGRGNTISALASPGLWNFYNRNGSRSVDNIRSEPYYGWIPKMDYEGIGNGYHNPAVRFSGVSKSIKESLGAPIAHSSLWAVKRGPVSHGCSRLAAGHAWEMRHLMPTADAVFAQTFVHINSSKAFDIYDIDGNGVPEIMGVEYLVRYEVKANDRREGGGGFEMDPKQKESFYRTLYGSKSVFDVTANGEYLFKDPEASIPSYLDLKKKSSRVSLAFNGEFKLFEQKYERDKVQFYKANPSNKSFIQFLGRIKGSAPANLKTSAATNSSEELFDKQSKSFGF